MWRLLNSRRVVAEWKKHRREFWVRKGCSQGTIWCLVVERLLRLLSGVAFFYRVYAVDVIIVIIADDPCIALELVRSTLKKK